MNYKSQVNEICHKYKLSAPKYIIDPAKGPLNMPVFVSGNCTIENITLIIDNGNYNKRKDIEQALAKLVVQYYSQKDIKSYYEGTSFINSIYLIDYDHNGHLKTLIESSNKLYEIFVGMSFNSSDLPKSTKNINIHQAKLPVSEMVDHMITWWCGCNLIKLQSYDNVYIVSKNKGLYPLYEILKENGVKISIMSNLS